MGFFSTKRKTFHSFSANTLFDVDEVELAQTKIDIANACRTHSLPQYIIDTRKNLGLPSKGFLEEIGVNITNNTGGSINSPTVNDIDIVKLKNNAPYIVNGEEKYPYKVINQPSAYDIVYLKLSENYNVRYYIETDPIPDKYKYGIEIDDIWYKLEASNVEWTLEHMIKDTWSYSYDIELTANGAYNMVKYLQDNCDYNVDENGVQTFTIDDVDYYKVARLDYEEYSSSSDTQTKCTVWRSEVDGDVVWIVMTYMWITLQ